MNKILPEDFKQEIEEDKKITLLSDYQSMRKRIDCQCNKCGFKWKATASNLKRGTRCPSCAKKDLFKKRTFTQEQFEERAYQNYPEIEIIGQYLNQDSYVECHCKKCENNFQVWGNSILSGKIKQICPYCRIDIRSTRLSNQEFINRVKEIHPDIEVMGDFSTTREKIKLKCNKCGYIWDGRANLLLFNHCGCPKCKESKGEKRVSNWLEKNGYIFLRQHKFDDCKDKKPLPFDFFLPELNICIEYDGMQHYFPYAYFKGEEKLQYTQRHDNMKNSFCENNNIKLIRISYLEYDEIEDILQKYFEGGDAE